MLTTTWRSPKVDTACSTIARAPSNELTLSVFATAWPPAATISSTTDCAAEMSEPDPSTAPPRSLTTTLAPSDPNNKACSRPMPRPPPVMIATLSCNIDRPSFRVRCQSPHRSAGSVPTTRLAYDGNGAPACQTRYVASRSRRSRKRRSASVPARSRARRYDAAASSGRPCRRNMSPRAAGRRW